jgi:hypothetical protein
MTRRALSVAGLGAGVAAIMIVTGLGWVMWPTLSDAEEQPLESAVVPAAIVHSSEDATVSSPPAQSDQSQAPAASPLDGLKISSQSWRRGGLGSKALVTFTLRNTNDYPVKGIEIACAFTRRDGSHLTDRKRVIDETVGQKSRRTFNRVLVGFVNVNADKAKCALVAASRVQP